MSQTFWIEVEVERSSGPFVGNYELAEAFAEEAPQEISYDESEFEVSSAVAYTPPALPKQRELKAAISQVVSEKDAGHVTQVVWDLLKRRGLTAR